jgi:hypothetical protein
MIPPNYLEPSGSLQENSRRFRELTALVPRCRRPEEIWGLVAELRRLNAELPKLFKEVV